MSVLSQSEATAPSGDAVYDRLCEAVCRLARMRRAIIFRYDPARRRVRAAGAYGLDLEQFAEAYVTVESAPIAARAIRGDRVVEIAGDVSDQFPAEYAGLFPEPVRLVCAPMTAAGWAVGVILADRLMPAADSQTPTATCCGRSGKTAALASRSRGSSRPGGDRAPARAAGSTWREIHEGVIWRLFGVSMALDGEGDLPGDARKRCASETQAALADLRAALQAARWAARRARPDDVARGGQAACADVSGAGTDAAAGADDEVPRRWSRLPGECWPRPCATRTSTPTTKVEVRSAGDGAFVAEVSTTASTGASGGLGWACGWRAQGHEQRGRDRVRRAGAWHVEGSPRRPARWLTRLAAPSVCACSSSTIPMSFTGAFG